MWSLRILSCKIKSEVTNDRKFEQSTLTRSFDFSTYAYILTEMTESTPGRPQKMWEILSKIPLIELDKLTPEEWRKLEQRAVRDLQSQLRYQARMNQTPDEFFGEKSSTEDTRR